MMIQCRDLTFIKTVKAAFVLIIVLLALSQVYFAASKTLENIERLSTWTRQPAEIAELGFDNEVEVITSADFADAIADKPSPKYCVARDDASACLLLTADPYAWLSVFDQVDLLQNPQQPNQLAIASVSGFWLPVAGHGFGLLLLAAAWYWLNRYSRWGEDITWLNGGWVATASSPQRIGFGNMDAEPITETAGSRKAVMFWLVLFLIIASTFIPAIPTSDALTMVYLVAVVGLVLLVLYTFAKTATRTIFQDQQGLVDSSLFGIKRIPWSEIAEVKLVNLNQDAQRSYDRRHTFSDERPETLNVYQVLSRQGQPIIRLSEAMSPSHAFGALLSRMRRQSSPPVAGIATFDKPPLQDDAAQARLDDGNFEAQAMRMMGLTMQARKSIFHHDHRGILISLVLMLAPFLLLTAYLAYKSLWFQYAAERTVGTVVEIQRDELPSLVVEYRTPQGNKLTVNSDGSAAYDDYRVGDTLTVFYDAEDPENARLDLFLELWLGTILMGALTAIVLLATVLIGRGLTTPMPTAMR